VERFDRGHSLRIPWDMLSSQHRGRAGHRAVGLWIVLAAPWLTALSGQGQAPCVLYAGARLQWLRQYSRLHR